MRSFFPLVIPSFLLRWCSLAASCLASLADLSGATVLTDFGQSGYETTTDPAGRRWNNVTQNAVAGTTINLIDTANAASGITLTLAAAFNLGDYNTNGDTSSAGLPYPATATRDSLFGNAGTFGSASNVVPVLTLTGLDATKTYALTFFASRSESDNRIAKYTVAGLAEASVYLDANGAAPHTVKLPGVAPAADGSIRITIRASSVAESGLLRRGAGDNATGFAYLGVLEIEYQAAATPPPGGTARPLAIMPLGSSITAGQSAQNPYNGGGYRTPLYQTLVADGRFAPAYVGSSTTLMANSPTAPNVLTAAGQLRHEGHPGYTTMQVLGNVNASDGSGGSNGGFWLRPGNGLEPDFIALNVGGNDFVQNHADTAAIGRLDTLVGSLAALRPGATIIVSSIVYRPDIGSYVDSHYNPHIEDMVFRHVLAGRRVRYLDLRAIMGTGYLSSDNVHPTQAGYDVMGAAWYQAIVNGAAYWTGGVDANWSTPPAAGTSNWATDASLLTARSTPPGAGADVYFVSPAGVVDPGANLSLRSLNFGDGANASITIANGRVLSLGRGGITVQPGSAAHEIRAGLTIATPQTWATRSATLTVAGPVGGSAALAVAGAGPIVWNGISTHSGPVSIGGGGELRIDGATAEASAFTVGAGGRLSGSGVIGGAVTCQGGGTLSPGGGGASRLRSGAQTWLGGAELEWDLADAGGAAGAGYDTMEMTGALNLAGASAAQPVRVRLRASAAASFHTDRSYTWVLAQASGGISGFSAGAFSVDAAGFLPSTAGGEFAVSADSTRLYLRFTPAVTLLGEWRRQHFGASDNLGPAANEADPDGDGVRNLLEYALGGDPLSAASAPRAVATMMMQDGARRFALTFVTNGDPTLRYQVEASGTLDAGWGEIWNGADFSASESITVVDPIAPALGAPRFLRIRIALR